MTIISKLEEEIKTSLKEGNRDRLDTLRLIKTAVKNKEIDLKHPLTEEEFFQVLGTQAKQRRDSIEQYRNAGRDELAQKEERELEIIQGFLPKQVSEEEALTIIKEAIEQTNSSSMKDMGQVMGVIRPKLVGKIDGKVLADLVKKSLS